MVAFLQPSLNIESVNNTVLVHTDTNYEKGVMRMHFSHVSNKHNLDDYPGVWTVVDTRRGRGVVHSFYGKLDLDQLVIRLLINEKVNAIEFITYSEYTPLKKIRLAVIRYNDVSGPSLRLRESAKKVGLLLTSEEDEWSHNLVEA